MQKFIYGIFIILFIVGCVQTTNEVPEFENIEQEKVFENLKKVYNWQTKNFVDVPSLTNWQVSNFFIGTLSAYRETGYTPFLTDTYNWADQNNWQIGSRTFNADDQAAAQVYIDLYKEFNKEFMISSYKDAVDEMIRKKLHEDDEVLWWWVDALFMAPPALNQLAEVTQNSKYLSFLEESWKESYNLLYSESDSLFFRDRRYNNDYDSQGNKMFWLRGNGWAVAGLAKLLEGIPDEQKKIEEEFRSVYIQLIEKLLSYQSQDGLWRSNLYYSDRYPYPETSGSALICYALAWGVNNGLLNHRKYELAMLSSWKGLVDKINEHGKLGYVQSVDYRPGMPEPQNAEIFGSGVFILAGSEMFNYYQNN